MKLLGRIYHLLQADERRKLVRMAVSVCLSALLNFATLAALLPVLYFLLEEGGKKEAALFFSLIAVAVIVVKGVAGTIYNIVMTFINFVYFIINFFK